MIKNSFPALLSRILYLSSVAIASQALFLGETNSATVDDPRPVAKAVELVEAWYGWRISYEDPPYMYSGDLQDITEKVKPTETSNSTSRTIIIPRGGIITVHADLSATQVDRLGLLGVVQGILDLETQRRGFTAFRLIQDEHMMHVVPIQQLDSGGTIQSMKPLLDNVISMRSDSPSLAQFLEGFCETLKQESGTRVIVGTIPLNLAPVHGLLKGGSGPARNLLVEALNQLDTPLSWQLFYDPGLKWYALNVHAVLRKPLPKEK